MDILPEETSDRVGYGKRDRRHGVEEDIPPGHVLFPLNKRVSRNVNSNACEALISRMGK